MNNRQANKCREQRQVRWLSLVEPAPRLGTVALGWGGASKKSWNFVKKWVIDLLCWKNTSNLSRIQQTSTNQSWWYDSAIFGAAQELPRADLHTWAEVHTLFKASKNRNLLCDWEKNMVLSDDTPFNPLVHHHVSLHFTMIFPSFSLWKWPHPRPATVQTFPALFKEGRMVVSMRSGGGVSLGQPDAMVYHVDWSFIYIYIHTGMMM